MWQCDWEQEPRIHGGGQHSQLPAWHFQEAVLGAAAVADRVMEAWKVDSTCFKREEELFLSVPPPEPTVARVFNARVYGARAVRAHKLARLVVNRYPLQSQQAILLYVVRQQRRGA